MTLNDAVSALFSCNTQYVIAVLIVILCITTFDRMTNWLDPDQATATYTDFTYIREQRTNTKFFFLSLELVSKFMNY